MQVRLALSHACSAAGVTVHTLHFLTKVFQLAAVSLSAELCTLQVGQLYSDTGRWAKAEPFYTQALELMEASLGPSHLHLANVCNGALKPSGCPMPGMAVPGLQDCKDSAAWLRCCSQARPAPSSLQQQRQLRRPGGGQVQARPVEGGAGPVRAGLRHSEQAPGA